MAAIDVGGLHGRRRELQNAILASAVPTRRILHETEIPVREVGQALFTALLGTGEVGGQYRASTALARSRGQALRVVVRVNDPGLAALPWEAMYDPAAGSYISRYEQLVRHIPVSVPLTPMAIEPPLRILAVAPSPENLPGLGVAEERRLLSDALAGPIAAGLVEISWGRDRDLGWVA